MHDNTYDAVVVGIGHAGVEAGLCMARKGLEVLMLSVSLDNAGYLACNPSIGGTAKGHLVKEIDALGGEMGRLADKTLTQLRMLNASKGPAVQSLRAQVDKYKYHSLAKAVLEKQKGIHLRQGEAVEIITHDDRVVGIRTAQQTFFTKALLLCTGVYLNSAIITGEVIEKKGPNGFPSAGKLSDSLIKLGIPLRRFKTGTPARIKRSTVHLDKLEIQNGEELSYSFCGDGLKIKHDRSCCYLGYTNSRTHGIIEQNLDKTARNMGLVTGAGARYCPSIEDKIVRFRDKERHQFFLEPEGEGTEEMYVQGISTSLPADVQTQMYRSIEGFEDVEIMRDAYAIEYDCIDSLQLYPTLMHKKYKGLFFAGQINGTSGYEEAAAQGLVAGINAAAFVMDQPYTLLTRDNSYIGVLIDDLVTKGTDEPYRMMTSRSEYRLCLRQDNADLRLTPLGRKLGLISDKRWKKYLKKVEDVKSVEKLLSTTFSPGAVAGLLAEAGEPAPKSGMTLESVMKRPNVTPALLKRHFDCLKDVGEDGLYEVFTEVRYRGYIQRQEAARKECARYESTELPIDADYFAVKGLRLEAAEKLSKIRPLSIGQAGRISGVNPADINVLIIALSKGIKRTGD